MLNAKILSLVAREGRFWQTTRGNAPLRRPVIPGLGQNLEYFVVARYDEIGKGYNFYQKLI